MARLVTVWGEMAFPGKVWVGLWGLGLCVGMGMVVNDRHDPMGWFLMLLGGMVTADVPLGIFRQKRMEKAWAATALALPMLDVFGEDGRLVGTNCELVDTRHIPTRIRSEYDLTYERFEQLCRTRSGQWFKLSFHTSWGKPWGLRTVRMTESEARRWFVDGQDIEKYSKYFGEPDVL